MRPFAILLFLIAGCAAPVPEARPAPLPEPPPRIMTIAVPDDCPHIMVVDILSTSKHESEITVACFTTSERTYMVKSTGPPIGAQNEPDMPTRLVIEYVPRAQLMTSSALP